MSRNKLIGYAALLIIIAFGLGYTLNMNKNEKSNSEIDSQETRDEEVEDEEIARDTTEGIITEGATRYFGGYTFETTNGKIITKELAGSYLNTFGTVVEKRDEFEISIMVIG